jgi:hypothetical protein
MPCSHHFMEQYLTRVHDLTSKHKIYNRNGN